MKELTKKRPLYRRWIDKEKVLYVEFATQLDFDQLSALFTPHLSHTRIKLQKAASNLNKESVNSYIKENSKIKKEKLNHIEYFAVNNSAIFYFDQIKKHSHKSYLESEISEGELVVAILDSGVSTNHEKLAGFDVIQFNPKDNNYGEKDTGLGHGTGILSLLEPSLLEPSLLEPSLPGQSLPEQSLLEPQRESIDNSIRNVTYLSCSGITDGQYNFINALRCFNWFFKQPKVDVMLNAWLVSEPGCRSEWDSPIQMTWMSGTIPVFAAGNNGEKQEQSYSPANLASLGDELPLLSVGSLSESGQRLHSSSQALSQCGYPHPLTSLYTNGENLKVAVPFQFESYQTVSGTSYAIAFVAKALLELKSRFPERSNKELVLALYKSANDLGEAGKDNEYGFGELDLAKAINLLENRKTQEET